MVILTYILGLNLHSMQSSGIIHRMLNYSMLKATTAMAALGTRQTKASSLSGRKSLSNIPRRRRSRRSLPEGTGEVKGGIEVHDNFFPSETQAEILRLMERPKWSLTGGRPPNVFWHMDDLDEEPYFRNHLFQLICDRLGRTFKIERIYANGQTALQYGEPHTDDGDVTFLYYPCPRWEFSWNGALLFLGDGDGASANREITTTIQYKPNRAVLFPAELEHYADAPSKSFGGLRVSLAYKLRLLTESRTPHTHELV